MVEARGTIKTGAEIETSRQYESLGTFQCVVPVCSDPVIHLLFSFMSINLLISFA